MGLDITAYKELKLLRPIASAEEIDYTKNEVAFYCEKHFQKQFEGITEKAAYQYADTFCFSAGSYSGYNRWRNALAVFAKYESAEAVWTGLEGPFSELINFSDCEGTIGPVVSAKLAKDFADHQAQADAHPDLWFRDRYAHWRKAFEMAAGSGAVDFH